MNTPSLYKVRHSFVTEHLTVLPPPTPVSNIIEEQGRSSACLLRENRKFSCFQKQDTEVVAGKRNKTGQFQETTKYSSPSKKARKSNIKPFRNQSSVLQPTTWLQERHHREKPSPSPENKQGFTGQFN